MQWKESALLSAKTSLEKTTDEGSDGGVAEKQHYRVYYGTNWKLILNIPDDMHVCT